MVDTAERILDSAQTLVQLRGYNGFSYADISADLALSKPSIHHHFPSKALLALALVERYRRRFEVARQPLDDPSLSPSQKLAGYGDLFARTFADSGRMCLCGVFATDSSSLPTGVREVTAAFFGDQLQWVADVLAGSGKSRPEARRCAEAFLAGLEGSLLLARANAGDAADASQVVPSVSRTLISALL